MLMSWVDRPLLTIALILGLIVATPLALFGAYLSYLEVSTYLFYRKHPLLKAMRDAPRLPRMGDNPDSQMTHILMARIPVGTSRAEALRILSDENLECAKPPSKGDMLVCGPRSRPAGLNRWYIGRWHMELTFDEDDRVLR